MRRKLAALGGGLVLAVAIGVPAGAQAAGRPSGTIHAATVSAGPEVVNPGPCAGLYDVGNHKYATNTRDGHINLYFAGPSAGTEYCNEQIGNSGQFEIVDTYTNQCLAVNSSNGTVDEDNSTACFTNEDSWDRWTAISENSSSQFKWLLKNAYNGECLYDDTQEPAIYSGCKGSDGFEQFIWQALP